MSTRTSAQDVVMPALGMAMEEGTLLRWLKQPGEVVEAHEPLAEIETDKVTMTVDSPVAGRLGAHLFEADALVPVGAILVRVDPNGSVESSPVAAVRPTRPPERARPAPAKAKPARRRKRAPVTTDGLRYRKLVPEADGDELVPIDLSGIEAAAAGEWLEAMVLIREFEEACEPLALAGKIPGGMHSAAGQEAVAVGAIRALAATDIVTSSHRSHHHSLAKGLTPRSVMAELYGKATGCLGGRAGHMHLADFSIGLYGSNGIVGAGLGIAMGASLASKLRGLDQVALGFFGDGGANTGRVWEFVNLAALWQLPLVVVCENNLYAVETHADRATAGQAIADRAAGFGLPVVQVDGQDVATVYRVVAEARENARAGEGPTFVEALTYRYRGHNTGDTETYRKREEVERWRQTRDPIARLARALELGDARLEEIAAAARAVVEDAAEFAERSPWPDAATAAENVTGPRE